MMSSELFWDITQLEWQFLTDVSGQPIGPIFKGQDIQDTLENETNKLSRKSIKNCQCTLCNDPEERSSRFHRGGSLK